VRITVQAVKNPEKIRVFVFIYVDVTEMNA